MGGESLDPTGIRSPVRPARRESHYRLRYPGPRAQMSTRIIPGHPGKSSVQPWEQELVAPQAAWASLFVAGVAQWMCLAWHRWQRCANFMFKVYDRLFGNQI
jgi:hypothetical protein